MRRNGSIAIVGGGAAGLAAAIAAGRALRSSACGDACDVAVFEADERVGRLILATGNGRCNFSNAVIEPARYRNGSFVAEALAALEDRLPASEASSDVCGNAVLRFFKGCGLAWREEAQGRLLPVTGKASTVLDVLRAAARVKGVREVCNARVAAIEVPREAGAHFTLRLTDGVFERAQAVVVAVGGRAGLGLLPKEVSTTPFSPVLGPLRTETRPIRALDNIRVRCAVELRRPQGRHAVAGDAEADVCESAQAHASAGRLVACEHGELLFRKYGVSGIAVYNLSRFAQSGDLLAIDLLDEALPSSVATGRDRAGTGECCAGERRANERHAGVSRADEAVAFLRARRDALAAEGLAGSCMDVLRGLMLPLVAEAVCARAGLKPGDAPTDCAMAALGGVATSFELAVEGMGDAKQCQVHRGGVDVAALDACSMGLRDLPGLFVAGEAADVDAPCGGYNLHWAWSSGLLAGLHAAAFALGDRR